MNTTTDTPKATNINRLETNHGHAVLVNGKWVAEYQTWCPSCRAAKAAK